MNPPVPPEPEPPGPEPEPVPVYTYSTSSQIAIGDTVGVIYNDIQVGDDSAGLKINKNGGVITLHALIVNEVPAFDMVNHYFCYGSDILATCVLAENATIGGTHPNYSYDSVNHSMVQDGTVSVIASLPTDDYFNNIKSGNFTLEQRS